MSDQPQSGSPSQPGLRDQIEPAADRVRRYSPALFGVAALAFLLPFLSVECAGRPIATMRGSDFIIGGKVNVDPEFEESFAFGEEFSEDFGTTDQPDLEELPEDENVDPSVFVIGAFAAAIIGLVVALTVRGPSRPKWITILAGLTIAGLLGFRFDVSDDTGGIPGAIEIKYRYGYWIALLLGLALAAAHILEMRRRSAIEGPPPPPT